MRKRFLFYNSSDLIGQQAVAQTDIQKSQQVVGQIFQIPCGNNYCHSAQATMVINL